VGGLGQDEQHGPMLRRGEAIHRRRRIGRPLYVLAMVNRSVESKARLRNLCDGEK